MTQEKYTQDLAKAAFNEQKYRGLNRLLQQELEATSKALNILILVFGATTILLLIVILYLL